MTDADEILMDRIRNHKRDRPKIGRLGKIDCQN